MMSLFAIFRSPLMFGGNLPDNDAFTLSLLNNKAVLEVNQHSSNNKQLFNKEGLIAWTADDAKTGDKYLAVFNATDNETTGVKIPVNLAQLGLNGTCTIKDLWTNKIIGNFKDEFAPLINRHASGLYRISLKK